MASDDGMDYNDYSDEDYYDDEEEYYKDDEYNNNVVDDDEQSCLNSNSNSSKTYTVLKEGDILRRQQHEITRVSAILSITEVAATKLLHYYRWNVSQLNDEWFVDEAKVRDEVGLPTVVVVPILDTEESATCGICFDCLSMDEIYPMICGHRYCKQCWKSYITVAINDGPGCLLLRCPDPSCRVAVCRDMVDELATEEERRKYYYYILRSYVEESKKIKWCPAPGCENAVEFELGNEVFDVTCICSFTFCWNCGEDAHRPVKCDTVTKWVKKNESESENTAWMLVNSKCCPKCKRHIEKNQGCMHMTCTPPCKFEFCWLCLGDWKKHHGGYYSCNKYEARATDSNSLCTAVVYMYDFC